MAPNLECRMYEARYPEVDMAVMIQVKNITSAQAISDQVESNCFVDAAVVSANFSIIAGTHLLKLKLI